MSLSINPTKWSPDTKKNATTLGVVTLAGVGAKYITKATKGKSYKWNTQINKPLKQFVKSEKTFFGSEFLKNIADKISKSSGRQKLLTTLAVATLATVMGVREHFSKQKGKESLKSDLQTKDKQIEARNNYISKQNDRISYLEADLMAKDSEINGLNKTLEAVDNAAEKLGVDKDLAQELQKQF